MTTAPPPAPPPDSSLSALASSLAKVCFNAECKELKSDRPKKGWRLRTGEFAELCDRCGSTFEEGRFCETFHLNASGWRSCESCGKLIHCGCIVSSHTFMLLDPGGIECFTCARKNLVMPSNPAWPSSFFSQSSFSERLNDLSVRSWSQLAGSGPVPWKQAPSLFNSSFSSSEPHPRVPYELEISNGVAKPNVSSLEKKIEALSERSTNGSINLGAYDLAILNDMKSEDKINSCLNTSQQSASLKEILPKPPIVLNESNASASERNGQIRMAGAISQSAPSTSQVKQYNGGIYNVLDASGENPNRNGQSKIEPRGRNQLLPRYWPRCTDQEKQQICREPNSDLTPLFQKTLSASDAGRIGRLVLPKKCAEAYFPLISQPEGLPLKILDMEGKEWVFQFRFWPNNNSRMYVLEGVTPCIQSMQLQAGDTVTFSRLEPGGKLVMGFRKASNVSPSDQDTETKSRIAANGDANMIAPSSWSKVDKSGYIAKEAEGIKSSVSKKRKSGILGLKSKKLRLDDEDIIELKITWEEAQCLLRPPPNHIPSIVVIEGFEFEEYEDAPVIGKPTIFTTDEVGGKIQWVKCEDCLKWRKLPGNAILPSRWTCSDNSTDPQRSSCSSAQELTPEQLEDLLTHFNSAPPRKMKAVKHDPDNVEALEGLDTLANLAILGEGEALPSSAQATTRHPRHRPGCTCIVCIQPPSGKGPKHKQSCTCNVCLTVKRRFRTLMLRREKKQSERDAESTRKKQELEHLPESIPENIVDDVTILCLDTRDNSANDDKDVNDISEDDLSRAKSSTSPFKGQIDLNIQPEREEELSPSADSGCMMKLLQDASERDLVEQPLSNGVGDSSNCQTQVVEGGLGEEKLKNSIAGSKNCDSSEDKGSTLPIKVAAST